MEHSSTRKKKPSLLFLNLFILTAHGSEGPEQLQSGYVRGGSFQFTAFPLTLWVYEKKISSGDNLGTRKGFSQAATRHHEVQTDGHPTPALCEPQFPSLQGGTTHSSPKDWCEADAGQDTLRARYKPRLAEHESSSRQWLSL